MGKDSKIEWTDHTFNPWWGCTKVSAGCKNCYAEMMANRFGSWWGTATERRFFGDKHWNEPLKWDERAKKEGVRRKVFCGSMCDVFEDKYGLTGQKIELYRLINATPNLDWLLLTKRPQNIYGDFIKYATGNNFGHNIWLGTSVENQEQADKRIPELLKVPAKVRFLSMEPLLGPVDLSRYLGIDDVNTTEEFFEENGWGYNDWSGGLIGPGGGDSEYDPQPGIHWVIVGGESGLNARPMHPDWALSIRDQCQSAGVPFFFKQWGAWKLSDKENRLVANQMYIYDLDMIFAKVGKKSASRLLDGREWNEVPE